MALTHVFNTVDNRYTGIPTSGVVVRAFDNPSDTITGTQLNIYASANSTPLPTPNEAVSDADGMYSFYIDAAAQYKLRFYVGSVLIKTVLDAQNVGPTGATGPANSTYATTALLEAAVVANLSAILTEAGKAGTFTIREYVDFTSQVAADTGKINYIRSTADVTKVWVRYTILNDAAGRTGSTSGLGVQADINARPTSAALAASGGSLLIGSSQAEAGASNVTLQTIIRKLLPVFPEQFGAIGDGTTDDTVALQAAIDAAGNWASSAFSRDVVLTQRYKTTASLLLRPYVNILGVGGGRSGIKPTMASGFAIDCDAVANTSALFHQMLARFRVDGVNMTGSASALRIQTQQHGRLQQMEFWNIKTTSHAVLVTGSSYAIVFDQCNWLGNNRHLKIAATAGDITKFPTTIRITNASIFEDTPNQANEAILIEDCSGVTFDGDTIFQSNRNLYTIEFRNNAVATTTSEHKIWNCYVENNGDGQVNSYFAYFNGHASNTLKGCQVLGLKCHQALINKPTSQIAIKNTDGIIIRNNNESFTGAKFVVDLTGNTNAFIDPRNVGACDLQDIMTPTAIGKASSADIISVSQGVASVAKQAVGRYRVTMSKAMASTSYIVIPNAEPASGIALMTHSTIISTTAFDVYIYAPNGNTVAPFETATDPANYSFAVYGKLA